MGPSINTKWKKLQGSENIAAFTSKNTYMFLHVNYLIFDRDTYGVGLL